VARKRLGIRRHRCCLRNDLLLGLLDEVAFRLVSNEELVRRSLHEGLRGSLLGLSSFQRLTPLSLVHAQTIRLMRGLLQRLLLAFPSLVLRFELVHDLIDAFIRCVFWEALDLSQRCFFEVNLVLFTSEHPHVVHKHLLRKSFEYPFMLEGLKWCHPVDWVPVETLIDEIQEFGVSALTQHTLEGLCVRDTLAATTISHDDWEERVFLEEKISAR